MFLSLTKQGSFSHRVRELAMNIFVEQVVGYLVAEGSYLISI